MYRTPVLGADIGGIPELIKENETGLLFKSGDEKDLTDKIKYLWDNPDITAEMSRNCAEYGFDNTEEYCKKLIKIYKGQGI